MLLLWIRSNSTTRDWGMLYTTHTQRYYFMFCLIWPLFLSNINQDNLPFGRAWLSKPSRASRWLAERNAAGMFYDWLRTHTQQGQPWLDEGAQRVTGADVVLLYSCCTQLPHIPLVCRTPETLCDWSGVDNLMRWKQIGRNGHFWELKIKARLYLISWMYERVSDLCSVRSEYQCGFILDATLWFERLKV